MEQQIAIDILGAHQDDHFSFDHGDPGCATAEAVEHSQEPSLIELGHRAGADIGSRSLPAAPRGGNSEDSMPSDTSTQQEPSLLQFADTGQEPSLAQSAVSSVAVAPEADASGEIQANTTACAMPQVGSSQLQDLNNCVGGAGDAQGSEADNVSSKQDNSQQHNTGSTSYSDSEKPVSAAEVATAATDHVGTTAASDHPSEAACREPDTSYFADGVRAIDVEVDCGPGTACKLLHVTMDISAVQQNPKPFLGGYRHKQNGVVYHHACSQTPPQPKQPKGAKAAADPAGAEHKDKLTRETQTVTAANTSSQTVREAATQMTRPGLELDCSGDRILTPRPYIPAAVVGQWQAKAALTIQRYTRGWMARQRAAALRAIKAERDEFLASAAAEREAAAVSNRTREVERRTHPLTREDFELLGRELETWRQQQTAAIKAAAEVAQSKQQTFHQQAALQLLLAKETRLLQTLDKLRLNAKQENKSRNTDKVLGNLSQPKTWTLSKGKKVMVHTPTTVRAAELQQLYRGLTLPSLTLDERLDVLLHVKWAVKEFDCALTRELVELIDREADLLNRGRSPQTLDGLRRRISGQFLAFCKTPAFNPEAHRLQLVPGGQSEPETFEYVDEMISTQLAD